jgi:hypothetical protein
VTLKEYFHHKIITSTLFAVLLIGIFCFANYAEAASLYFTSSSNNVTVGSLVTINLLVNTQGKTINNTEATIQFSNDLLDIVSIKGTLFSLWVENPSFSNSSGRISFNGGIPDPGYNGSSKILTIIAKAKKAGTASFVIGDAAVRENDGLGTDILTGQSPISFNITSNTPEPEVAKPTPLTPVTTPVPVTNPVITTPGTKEDATNPPTTIGNVGNPATISSATYNNQDSWYIAKDGNINWNLPSQASAVQTLIDHNPDSTPVVKYNSRILSKNLSDLDDGVWYFHLRYLLNNKWSAISHYKIQIDTTPPFGLAILPVKTGDCMTGLKISANDAVSGVDYYHISIDNQPVIKILASNSNDVISLSQLTPGNHQVLVTAFDKAGNKSDFNTSVNIDKLSAPTINSLSDNIYVGETLKISGESVANTSLKLVIASESGLFETSDLVTDELGKFSFESKPLTETGNYRISVYAVGCSLENNSLPAEINVEVKNSTSSLQLGAGTPSKTDYSLLFNLVKLIIILILLFGWYKYVVIKTKLLVVSKRARRLSISALLEKADKDLSVLERARKKHNLTRNEEKSLISLKKIISDIDDINKAKK